MSVLPHQVSARFSVWRVQLLQMVRCGAFVLAVVFLTLPSFASGENKQVIAHIDGQPVTGEAFAPYLSAYLRSKLYHAGSPERVRALAEEAIEAFLIDRVLGEQAAARGVKIDEAAVEKRIATLKAQFGNRPEWPQIRERMPKLRKEIETDLRIEALKREITHAKPPSELEIRAYYERRPDLFTRPAAYRLRLLLVGVDPGASTQAWQAAETQVQDYARRAAAGEEFAHLARAHSTHRSRDEGGAIGLIHEGQLGEAAEVALRASEPGGLAGPVRLLEGIALFKVEEKRLPALMAFAEVRERAHSLLERERARSRWTNHVKAIRARFTIDRSALAAFVARTTQ